MPDFSIMLTQPLAGRTVLLQKFWWENLHPDIHDDATLTSVTYLSISIDQSLPHISYISKLPHQDSSGSQTLLSKSSKNTTESLRSFPGLQTPQIPNLNRPKGLWWPLWEANIIQKDICSGTSHGLYPDWLYVWVHLGHIYKLTGANNHYEEKEKWLS